LKHQKPILLNMIAIAKHCTLKGVRRRVGRSGVSGQMLLRLRRNCYECLPYFYFRSI